MRMKLTAAALALGLLAGPAAAGDVEGNVTISGKVRDFKRGQTRETPGYVNPQAYNASDHPPTKNELDNVVVYLTGEGLKCTPKVAKEPGNTIKQKNYQFNPHVLVVPKGSKVFFKNEDSFIHRVYSVSEPARFDFRGFKDERNEELPNLGEIELFCGIHTGMNAYLIVTPNDYFARSDASGHYVLKNVPPGTYKMTIWHPRLDSVQKTVTIPKSGNVTLDVSL